MHLSLPSYSLNASSASNLIYSPLFARLSRTCHPIPLLRPPRQFSSALPLCRGVASRSRYDQEGMCPAALTRDVHIQGRKGGLGDKVAERREGIDLQGKGCCRWGKLGRVSILIWGCGRVLHERARFMLTNYQRSVLLPQPGTISRNRNCDVRFFRGGRG